MEENKIWTNSAISEKLTGKEGFTEYKEALTNLSNVASVLAPGGRLIAIISSESEKFRPIEKMAANIALSKRLYNERAITTNPEIGMELARILELTNEFNKIIDSRKKKSNDFRRPKNNQPKKSVKQEATQEVKAAKVEEESIINDSENQTSES